jgi:hypothetical protein
MASPPARKLRKRKSKIIEVSSAASKPVLSDSDDGPSAKRAKSTASMGTLDHLLLALGEDLNDVEPVDSANHFVFNAAERAAVWALLRNNEGQPVSLAEHKTAGAVAAAIRKRTAELCVDAASTPVSVFQIKHIKTSCRHIRMVMSL